MLFICSIVHDSQKVSMDSFLPILVAFGLMINDSHVRWATRPCEFDSNLDKSLHSIFLPLLSVSIVINLSIVIRNIQKKHQSKIFEIICITSRIHQSKMKRRHFDILCFVILNDFQCFHRNHQCFINVASMFHQCLINVASLSPTDRPVLL